MKKQRPFILTDRIVMIITVLVSLLMLAYDMLSKNLAGSKVLAALLLLAVFITATIQLIRTNADEKFGRLSSIIYNLAYLLLVYFFISPNSPYIFLGIGILINAAFYLGSKITSLLLFAHIVTIFSQYLYLIDSAALTDALRLTAVYCVLAILAISTVNLLVKENDKFKKESEVRNLEHKRLNTLINSMGDAVIATDENGHIINYNGAALQILDTNQDIKGKLISEVMHLVDKDDKPVNILLEASKKGRNIYRDDLKLVFGPDDYINLYINITPIKEGYLKQSMRGYTILFRDITKEKSLEEERDEFISVISHELRTPVTIAEGKVSNAIFSVDKKKNKKIYDSLSEAHDQIVFLAEMLNDLASLARAERTEKKLELEDVDPASLVENLVEVYRNEAKQKGLEVKAKVIGNPKPIYTSKMYLKEILQNFVTNAIKYTKKGSITIGVKEKDKGVEFFVKDTGIGISKTDQKHLFEKFYRSENYQTRETSGTGLGLYVAAKLTNKIKAKIAIDSKLNHGSTFYIYVPSLPKPKRHR